MAETGEKRLEKAQFMEEIQKFDCLYNKYSKEFKDNYKMMNCRRNFGGKFNLDLAESMGANAEKACPPGLVDLMRHFLQSLKK